MTAPILALSCRVCGWRPDRDQPMGVVAAHVETEHPEAYDPENLELDMRAYCPRDNTDLSEPGVRDLGGGRERLSYECPTCHRSYELTRDPPS